ncbi:hypothetical protein GCM10010307_21750 [Streptomyces vastus]|uniref:Uncharacterized protein n=1 Tax=Streptomyces vastus TaxID=285451 RepID=A0ABN3QME6_9ACTN
MYRVVSGWFPDRSERSQSRRNPDQVFDRPAVILFKSKSGIFADLRVKVPMSGMLNLEAGNDPHDKGPPQALACEDPSHRRDDRI